MRLRKPLKPYSRSLHASVNTWGMEDRFALIGMLPCFWITCNGERVDLRGMGFSKPYYLGYPGSLLEMLRQADDREAGIRSILEGWETL
jgi:hypothetical protein